MPKKEPEKEGVEVVYGGRCILKGKASGFSIFRLVDGEYKAGYFNSKGIYLGDKVNGGIYIISSFDDNKASFRRFESTGQVTKDKDLIQQITKQELDYDEAVKDRTATSAAKKYEVTIKNMTLGELKKRAESDYRLAAGVKRWVNNNF